MTIENLKQIAIKYATTKGSRVPLAPDELCNAVVQYFNEFLKITADINTIQVAVTEEGGNIVFTITGNTLDGKAFTPIVITVDHNDFVTNQEFEEFKTTTNAAIQKNTESINSLSFRVEDTENDITTIQVQVGQINTRVGNTETDVTNLKNRVDNTETNIAKIDSTLNNKLDKVSSTTSVPQVYVKEYNGTQTMIDLSESTRANSIPTRNSSGRMYTEDGISSDPSSVANMRNIAAVESKIPDISNLATTEQLQEVENKIPNVSGFATKEELQNVQNSLNNKRSVISSPASSYVVYTQANGLESNLPYSELANQTSTNIMARRANGTSDVKKGISGENVANMENIADVEAKIPSTDNFLLKNVVNIINYSKFKIIDEIGSNIIGKDDVSNNMSIGSDNYPMRLNSSMRPIIHTPIASYQLAYRSDVPAYKNVYSVSYDSANGAIITYDGANEIHIPLLAGENVTINASEDNKKIVISAAGGGGTGDVTAAGNNTFTGVNTFNNTIYAKNGVVAVDTTNYGANSVRKGPNTYSFPNKSGTFAMTTDVIKNPIYFISFYANEPSETCHLIGTMMSKNSYGTGQKTNEEFAVMLADNLYTNSNEGLAAYGKLAKKDILCIYSEDGLSIRCLDEENSEVDLPTVMFFVMETEL